jgi:CHAT domain-containing protein
LYPDGKDNVYMFDLGEAEPIDKMIKEFRRSLIDEIRKNDNRHLSVLQYNNNSFSNIDIRNDIGHSLRSAIFDPLISSIADCKRLFIAPDGDINLIPFEVLPTSEDNRLLIEDYHITYLTTGREVLDFAKKHSTSYHEPIVISDPDFDLHQDSPKTTNIIDSTTLNVRHSRDLNANVIHFERLAGTREEGILIAKILGVRPYMGSEVLKTQIKIQKSPSVLHIATHGFFLPDQIRNFQKDATRIVIINSNDMKVMNQLHWTRMEDPMLRSGLALAGANTWLNNGYLSYGAENGILTAYEILLMDLSNTELVILSACETGLGEIHMGEGVFGLRRAFVLAGAQTLVMSLWKVPDEQTKELMVDFYKRLLSGKPRAEALREAQLAMKEKYPDPYYWGAFICQGNPGQMSSL